MEQAARPSLLHGRRVRVLDEGGSVRESLWVTRARAAVRHSKPSSAASTLVPVAAVIAGRAPAGTCFSTAELRPISRQPARKKVGHGLSSALRGSLVEMDVEMVKALRRRRSCRATCAAVLPCYPCSLSSSRACPVVLALLPRCLSCSRSSPCYCLCHARRGTHNLFDEMTERVALPIQREGDCIK